MTNDLTTVEGVLQQAIDDLETNLQSMGVNDAEFNPVTGILGLIARITEIEPSVAGLDLDTNITCSSENAGNVGVPLTITGVLSASYDDTSATDIDLNGVLQNATVKIYNGNTLLGTAVTDNNGRYTFEYTPLSTGVLSIVAIFEGTENYDNCQSSNILVDIYSLTLISSSNIVSVGDTITLTATYLDSLGTGIENESIDFIDCSDDSIIGTATTDSNGQCSVSYSVKDTNSLNIKAIFGNIESCNISIEIYYKVGIKTSDTWHQIQSIGWISVSAEGVATGRNRIMDYGWDNSKDWVATFDYNPIENYGGVIITDTNNTSNYDKNNVTFIRADSYLYAGVRVGTTQKLNTPYTTNFSKHNYKVEKVGSRVKLYWKLASATEYTLIAERDSGFETNSVSIGVYTWMSSNSEISNLKVKSL